MLTQLLLAVQRGFAGITGDDIICEQRTDGIQVLSRKRDFSPSQEGTRCVAGRGGAASGRRHRTLHLSQVREVMAGQLHQHEADVLQALLTVHRLPRKLPPVQRPQKLQVCRAQTAKGLRER